jgi:hypothetical protein
VHGNAHNVCQIIESVIDNTGTRTMRYNITCDSVIGNEAFLMGVQDFDSTGTQFAYHNPNGSLRVGDVSGTQWNLSKLGDNSVAFGVDTTALGSQSFSVGSSNLVNGTNNVVFGSSNLLFDNFSSNASPLAPTIRTRNSIILNGESNDIAADAVISDDSIAINSIIGGTQNELVIMNSSTALSHKTLGQATDTMILGGSGTDDTSNIAAIGIGSNTFTTSISQTDITAPVTNSMLFYDGHPNSYPTLHEVNTLKQVFKRGFIRAAGSLLNGYGDDGARERMIPFEAVIAANTVNSFDITISQDTIISVNGSFLVAGYDSGTSSFASTVETLTQFIVLRSSVLATPSQILLSPIITQLYATPGYSFNVTDITVSISNVNAGVITVYYNNFNDFDVKVHAVFYAYDMILTDLISPP